MIERRLGLTARLALVGIVSALVPFAIGVLVFLAMPDRIAGRQADADLDRSLSFASTEVQERRADLAFALARVDDRELAALVRRDDTDATRVLVARTWGRSTGSDPSALRVSFTSTGDRTWPSRGEVGAYVDVRAGTAVRRVHVVEVGAMDAILRRVGNEADVRLAVQGVGGESFGDDQPARVRTLELDAETDTVLAAGIDGSSTSILLRGRSREVQAALVMLLAAGVLCAISMALVMNRMLGRVADVAERMSGGDFDTRLPVVGVDANARVATSLNELAAKLQDRIGTLERTVDRLDRTLAAIDDGVCTWSKSGTLETWNAGAERLTGLTEAAARAGGPSIDVLRDERSRGRRRILLPVAGRDAHIAVDLSVRRMSDGGCLQVFRDAAPAVSIEQARANFLVTAAHELRTPLTSILGFAATLADPDLELDDAVRRVALEQVLSEAQRLEGVVHALFETSLLVRDKLEVTLEPIGLRDLMALAAGARGIADELDLSGIDEGLVVRADREALARAIGAVLDNAAKYGRPPIIVAAHVVADTRVRVAVRDDGDGIPVALHDAVFEPFHRLDPEMRSDVGGAGMGLYNARRLVEAMDGHLTIGRCDELETRGRVRGLELVFDLQRWVEPGALGAPVARSGVGAS